MGRARGTKRRRKGKKHGSKRQARKVQKANRAISKPRSLVVSPTALRTAEARGGALTLVRDVLAIDVQAGASRRGYAIMPSRHDKLLRQVVADFVQQHPCLQGMRLLNSWAKAAVVDAYTRQGLSRGWTPGPFRPLPRPLQSNPPRLPPLPPLSLAILPRLRLLTRAPPLHPQMCTHRQDTPTAHHFPGRSRKSGLHRDTTRPKGRLRGRAVALGMLCTTTGGDSGPTRVYKGTEQLRFNSKSATRHVQRHERPVGGINHAPLLWLTPAHG